MRCVLINPPSPVGLHVMRSYSGGFGDLFVANAVGEERILFPPIELMRFATACRRLGWEAEILDLQASPLPSDDLRLQIEQIAPELIFVSTSLPTIEQDAALIRMNVAGLVDAKVIFVTPVRDPAVAKYLQEIPSFFAIVTPDAAADMPAVLDGSAKSNVIYVDKSGEFVIHPLAHPDPADLLPEPAFDLVDYTNYSFSVFRDSPKNFVATIHSSYGCPYPCGFYCPYPLAEGIRVRRHSLERVISEIETALRCGAKSIVFRDPLFSSNSKFVHSLCSEILRKSLKFRWWCESRIDRLPSNLLDVMFKSGCVGLEVGVESGDESVMTSEGKVGLTLAKVREFHSAASSLGLHVVYLFLFGLPTERKVSLLKTVQLIQELGLSSNEFNISIITPYPGTKLHSMAQEKGWIEENPSKITGYSVTMRTDVLSTKDLNEASEFAKRLAEIRSASWVGDSIQKAQHTSKLILEMAAWAGVEI